MMRGGQPGAHALGFSPRSSARVCPLLAGSRFPLARALVSSPRTAARVCRSLGGSGLPLSRRLGFAPRTCAPGCPPLCTRGAPGAPRGALRPRIPLILLETSQAQQKKWWGVAATTAAPHPCAVCPLLAGSSRRLARRLGFAGAYPTRAATVSPGAPGAPGEKVFRKVSGQNSGNPYYQNFPQSFPQKKLELFSENY